MSLGLVWLDGGYVTASEARVSVFDRGLAYGDGAFTTLRVGGGEPLLIRRHLERLGGDLCALGIPPPAADTLEAACRGLIRRLGLSEAVLKITVTRGVGGRGPAPPESQEEQEPTAFISASPLPPPRPTIRATAVRDERGPLVGRYKSLNYLANVLALREARERGFDEALLTRDETLVEAAISNLISGTGNIPKTSPAAVGALPGIARGVLLDSGEIEEGEIPTATPGPLYCVNSVRGVEPVAELDGRSLVLDPDLEGWLDTTLRDRGALPPCPAV